VASAAFNQTFDLKVIANAFPRETEFKGRFPGLVFRLKKPKTTMLIFKTGKMVCTGGKGEDEARRAILGAVRKLRKGGINVAGKPEIQITNIVASANLDGVIDLDRLYSSGGMGWQNHLRTGAVSGPDLPMGEPTSDLPHLLHRQNRLCGRKEGKGHL